MATFLSFWFYAKALVQTVKVNKNRNRFFMIGEIRLDEFGLDFFVPELNTSPLKEKQEH